MPYKHPSELKEQAIALYKNTPATIDEISACLNVNKRTIWLWITAARQQGIIPKELNKGRYDDDFKVKAIKLAQEIGIAKAARQIKVKYTTLRKWCIEANCVPTFFSYLKIPMKNFDLLQIDGCIFAVNPKWYWLTIATQELPEIVFSLVSPDKIAEDDADEATIKKFLNTASLKYWMFSKKPKYADYFDEKIEDFQKLAIEKCVEVFTELKRENRRKYFRTVSVIPHTK